MRFETNQLGRRGWSLIEGRGAATSSELRSAVCSNSRGKVDGSRPVLREGKGGTGASVLRYLFHTPL